MSAQQHRLNVGTPVRRWLALRVEITSRCACGHWAYHQELPGLRKPHGDWASLSLYDAELEHSRHLAETRDHDGSV